jgi:hypothetical protein
MYSELDFIILLFLISMDLRSALRDVIFKQWIIDPNLSHNALCILEVLSIKNCVT